MESKESQQQINTSTRDEWDNFTSHRQKVTDLIARLPDDLTSPDLAILGAGNGNDILYADLCRDFERVHLFDFDSNSLEYLKLKQLDELPSNQFVIESAVDLSGVDHSLRSFSSATTDAEIIELVRTARENKAPLDGKKFDIVVSVCMLTQLLDNVVKSVGDEAQYKHEIMIALRDGHLRLMSRLLKTGGKGLLVTDFVSSDTLPELADANTDEEALQLARKAIDQRNFFTGANPWAIKDSLAKVLVETPASPWSIAPPWRWQIGDHRFYLVTAIEFSKQF